MSFVICFLFRHFNVVIIEILRILDIVSIKYKIQLRITQGDFGYE